MSEIQEKKPWAKPGIDTPDITPEKVEEKHLLPYNPNQAGMFHNGIKFNYLFDDLPTSVPNNKKEKFSAPNSQIRKKMSFKMKVAKETIDYSNLPSKVDMRNYSPGIYNQGTVGSCVAQSICAAVQIRNNIVNNNQWSISRYTLGKKAPVFSPSRLKLYWHARIEEGYPSTEDTGSSMHSGMIALEKYKLCDEKLWPYEQKKFNQQPPHEAFLDSDKYKQVSYMKVEQNVDVIKYTLSKGYPICFGIIAYSTLTNSTAMNTGKVELPRSNDSPKGGHAILLLGYDEESKVFIFQNSWSNYWGDHGFGYLPYDYVASSKHAADFWAIKNFQ